MNTKRMPNWFGYVVVAIIVIGWAGGAMLNKARTHRQLEVLKSDENILRFEMKILSAPNSMKQIVIIDKTVLDSIDAALKSAVEIKGELGSGNIDIFCTLYKKNGKVEFNISYSVYHGWQINLGAQFISSEYMINFVKPYVDTTKYSK